MNQKMFLLKIVGLLLMIILGMTASGLAAIPSSYNIDIQYGADQAVIPVHLKAEAKIRGVTISVAEFTDERQVSDKKKIGHVREIGDVRVPVYPKQIAITRIVADGVREYLKKAGYKVADKVATWDLKEGTVPKGSGKVIISGSIEELEVTCWTGVFSNDYKINMKLLLVVADAAKGKILYKSNVTVAGSRTDVSFSEGQLGHEASVALADAINKLFEGKTVAQKIKEAMMQ